LLASGLHDEIIEVTKGMMQQSGHLDVSFFHNVQLARAYLRGGEILASLQTWQKVSTGEIQSSDPEEKQIMENALYAYACELGQVIACGGELLYRDCMSLHGRNIGNLVARGLPIAVANPERKYELGDGITVVDGNRNRVSWSVASVYLPSLAAFVHESGHPQGQFSQYKIQFAGWTKDLISLNCFPNLRVRQLAASINYHLKDYKQVLDVAQAEAHVLELQNHALRLLKLPDWEGRRMMGCLPIGSAFHHVLPLLKISRDAEYSMNGLEASSVHWERLSRKYFHSDLLSHRPAPCTCSECFTMVMAAEEVEWAKDRGEFDYAEKMCLKLLAQILELRKCGSSFKGLEMIPQRLLRNLYLIWHARRDYISMIVIHEALYGHKADPSGFQPFLCLGLSEMGLRCSSEGLPMWRSTIHQFVTDIIAGLFLGSEPVRLSELYSANRQYDEALEQCRAALSKPNTYAEDYYSIQYTMANLQYSRGHQSEAISLAEDMMKEYPPLGFKYEFQRFLLKTSAESSLLMAEKNNLQDYRFVRPSLSFLDSDDVLLTKEYLPRSNLYKAWKASSELLPSELLGTHSDTLEMY
jgi:tetratricopeptide (TPR) repeat protein